MSGCDLITVVNTVILFRPVCLLIHGHWELPLMFHDIKDIYGSRLEARLRDLDRLLGSRWVLPCGLSTMMVLAGSSTTWRSIDPSGRFPIVIGLVAGLVTWKAVTLDIDLATGRTLLVPRVLLLLSYALSWVHPALLVPTLFVAINYLRAWYHHQHLVVRSLMMFIAGLVARPMSLGICGLSGLTVGDSTLAASLLPVLCVIVSHYVVAGVSKTMLGQSPGAWVRYNRLHYLAISAYLWGWLRKIPETTAIRCISSAGRFDRLLQGLIVVFELSGLMIGFDRWWAVGFFVAAVVFHAGVFVLSGILFWQAAVTAALIAGFLAGMPPLMASACFGPSQGLLFALIVLLGPLRGYGWRPQKLAWWDTPYIARIRWRVVGASGVVYDLHNDFMCPNERLFGKGDFRTDEPYLNGHLGETLDLDLRDRILESGGDPEALDRLKRARGRTRFGGEDAEAIAEYLRRFFGNWNRRNRKRVCPRWLKAPGGLFFYWGTGPDFRGQELVSKVVVAYREEFFDGRSIRIVMDRTVREVNIDGGDSLYLPGQSRGHEAVVALEGYDDTKAEAQPGGPCRA
jgi:hypothetical protein